MGDTTFQHQFPRLFRLEVNQDCMVRDRWNGGWNWIWSRRISGDPNNEFSVKKTCIHLDNALLPDAFISTRWCPFIPKKVNIFIWRALRDRLLTRWNLSNKGVELNSILCPNCSASPETIHHSLWECSLATRVWAKVFSWLDLPFPSPLLLQDVYVYVDQLHIQKDMKLMLHAIFGVVLWTLWSFQNNLVFSSHQIARNEIFDKIIGTSFLWYTNRNRKANFSWNNWLQNPLFPYVSLECSGNTTRIMRRTLMKILVFTLCEEQVKWNSILMRLIDDLLALDSIVHFGFSDRRLERTATFSISTHSE
ncbi:RNA-directed DNA polymerase, eukaryota [Tanacetum coccineum]